MNKNNKNIEIIIAVVIGVVLIAGGGLFIANKNSQDKENAKMAMEKAAMMQKDKSNSENEMMKKDNHSMSDSSHHYIEYSKSEFDNAANVRRVLFFYASWCPICRPVDASIKANTDQIPENLIIIRVNYNDPDTDQEEKDLAKKYGVTYQHTFVQIDENGNQLNKWSGGEIKEILSNLK